MDRQQALEAASRDVCFDEGDFDGSGVYRLGRSVANSVEPFVAHGLNRVHAWLWPVAGEMRPGETVARGAMSILCTNDDPALDREWSRKSFVATVDARQWRLSWFDMEGRDTHLAVGNRPDDVFSAAYGSWSSFRDGSFVGHVTGKGSDVRRFFEFLDAAAREMPPEIPVVRDATVAPHVDSTWLPTFLDAEGGLAGSMAADLYEMVEQRACAMLARWAAPRALLLADFLAEHGFTAEGGALRYNEGGNEVFAVDTGVPSRVAFVRSGFPGNAEGDTYLSWFDLDGRGGVETLCTYALPAGASLDDTIAALAVGAPPDASASHDFATGKTSFGDSVKGYDQLADFCVHLGHDTYAAVNFDPEDEDETWERVATARPGEVSAQPKP